MTRITSYIKNITVNVNLQIFRIVLKSHNINFNLINMNYIFTLKFEFSNLNTFFRFVWKIIKIKAVNSLIDINK